MNYFAWLVFGFSVAVSNANAKNYALVVAGKSRQSVDNKSSYFSVDGYLTSAGLQERGWDTQFFYNQKEGREPFPEGEAVVNSLTKHGVSVRESSKQSISDSIDKLASILKPGDKVFLSIAAHGATGRKGQEFHFDLYGADGVGAVTEEELAKMLSKLKHTGAKVAVVLTTCNSGDFSPKLRSKLMADEKVDKNNVPGICMITSSAAESLSVVCVESDFDKSGKFKAKLEGYSSAASFVSSWLLFQKKQEFPSPHQGPEFACWNLEKSHYQDG